MLTEIVPSELFSPVNIVGLGVATAAVNAATNTARLLAKRLPPQWVAFTAALVVAYLTASLKSAPRPVDWILAFFNACLLFCGAFGLNEIAAGNRAAAQGFAAPQRFFASWQRPQPAAQSAAKMS